jgi:hypothetical protein
MWEALPPKADLGLQHLWWAPQELCGIVGQSPTAVGSGHGVLEDSDRRIRHHDDFVPAASVWEIAVLVTEMARDIDACGCMGCLVHDHKFEGREITSSRCKDYVTAHSLKGKTLAVHLHT